MTGCDVIKGYYMLLADLEIRADTPIQALRKAFELRTGKPFYQTLIKNGKHVQNVYRGLLLYILRFEYAYTLFNLRKLTRYNCNQPIYRSVYMFQSELTINPTLRRDYEAIKNMLSIN